MTGQQPTGPLGNLVLDLLPHLAEGSPPGRVLARLEAYARDHRDWQPFAHFGEESYTRNLVSRSARYELLVLCWGVDQQTPVHDHAGQRCWMVVLDGTVVEELFHRREEGGPLRAGATRRCQQGDAAYITDEMALHRIGAEPGQRAVSLHLYSRPIEACGIYDPVTGERASRSLGYHSVGGVVGQ